MHTSGAERSGLDGCSERARWFSSVGRLEEEKKVLRGLVSLAPLARTPSMPDLPQEGGGTATADEAAASATLVRLELRARLREQHGVVRSNDDE